MGKYKNQNIIEERIEIEGIPCLRFYPSETSGFGWPFPTVFRKNRILNQLYF